MSCVPLLRMEKQLLGRCPSPLWYFSLVLNLVVRGHVTPLKCFFQEITAFACSIAVGGSLSVTYYLQSACVLLLIGTFLSVLCWWYTFLGGQREQSPALLESSLPHLALVRCRPTQFPAHLNPSPGSRDPRGLDSGSSK